METNEPIPFYGASDRGMFEIERTSMDRGGVVTRYLDSILPSGRVLDVGAGDGFVAERLQREDRRLIALEPASGMIDTAKPVDWVRGVAQSLPFPDRSLDGAYATFAYFFPSIGCGEAGLAELDRVLRPAAPFAFADSAGDDEFIALSNPNDVNRGMDIASPRDWWHERGFRSTVLHTAFEFRTLDEAQRLLGFFFGQHGRASARLEIGFDVIVYLRLRA